MITVQKLTKKYETHTAVDSLSFQIRPGEIIGFLGPNGAGKTTTMRIMAGYLSPDEGRVTIDGISVEEEPTLAQRHIGYLPESNPLYKDMLVSDFLNLSADLKQISPTEKKSAFEFVVSATGINEVFYRPISELSKGYKQRVGLAAALLHEPKVLILDEPTEGLDPIQRNEIRSLVRELSKKHTIFMSTHVMQEVSAVCSRVLIINKGKLVADGTPENLARQAAGTQILTVDIEGSKAVTQLKGMKGVQEFSSKKLDTRRTRFTLTAEKNTELQPEISRLAREHKWIIWKLEEKGQGLEDIFQTLTEKDT